MSEINLFFALKCEYPLFLSSLTDDRQLIALNVTIRIVIGFLRHSLWKADLITIQILVVKAAAPGPHRIRVLLAAVGH